MCVCVCVCVRACACACLRACVQDHLLEMSDVLKEEQREVDRWAVGDKRKLLGDCPQSPTKRPGES